MTALRTALLHNRALAAMVLAVALLVRAVVPGGYMAASQAGSITITLCADASGTPKQVQVALGDHTTPAKDLQDKQGPCAFAGLAAALLAEPVIAAEWLPPVAALVPLLAQRAAPGRGLAAPPPFQTGPPLQA